MGAPQLAQMPKGAVRDQRRAARRSWTPTRSSRRSSAGHLGGASLDVFPQEPLPPDHPLWTTPNVILTPHTSGFREGHWDDVIELFGDNLDRWLRGRASDVSS